VKEEYRSFLPMESLSIYTDFTTDIGNHLNEKLINYTKVRQFKILDKMVLDTIETIQKKALDIYETRKNPYLTIEEINKLWDKKLTELSASADLSNDEQIEIFDRTKGYIEEELKGFRSLIFGSAYNHLIKSNVLEWSSDTRHLAADGYKELHNLITVKCPGCQYPWGNHGACPNRICLFCATSFKWNSATVVVREDWDNYDYSPAYIPRVASSASFKTPKTLLSPSLK